MKYHIETNLGTEVYPFIIKQDLVSDSRGFAWSEFINKIENCNIDAEWRLFEDNKPTETYLTSTSAPKDLKGYKLVAEITGDTEADLLLAIDQIKNDIHCNEGFNSNDSGSYKFTKHGEELEPNVYDLSEGYRYALIEPNGFALETDEEDTAEDDFALAGSDQSDMSWDGDLIFVEYVDYQCNDLGCEDEVLALDRNGCVVKKCGLDEMIQWLKHSDEKCHLYQEISRKSSN